MKNKILIVDDNIEFVNELTYFLKRTFPNIANVSNGIEALDFLKNQPVDIIISDYRMPKMNGIVLLRNCKRNYPDIPFILISSHMPELDDEILRKVDFFAEKNSSNIIINGIKFFSLRQPNKAA